ncbi:unnamed protein product [Leuciscus chuanchicus]
MNADLLFNTTQGSSNTSTIWSALFPWWPCLSQCTSLVTSLSSLYHTSPRRERAAKAHTHSFYLSVAADLLPLKQSLRTETDRKQTTSVRPTKPEHTRQSAKTDQSTEGILGTPGTLFLEQGASQMSRPRQSRAADCGLLIGMWLDMPGLCRRSRVNWPIEYDDSNRALRYSTVREQSDPDVQNTPTGHRGH